MVQPAITTSYLPIFEFSRGEIIESIHFGALAIMDSRGMLLASHGNPELTSYLRSSAKPFQALPFIEAGGHKKWGLSPKEIAILCGSHSGTDEHYMVLSRLQEKIQVSEADLLCGVHPPIDVPTRKALDGRGEYPSPNRHNCSGKHTGMLAMAKLTHNPTENYIAQNHPIQKMILRAFSEMCDIAIGNISLGIDGCSAPVFAIPLHKAAFGYARLCDPVMLGADRAAACQTLTGAMMDQPVMVAGPGKFDTCLMEVCRGRIVSKGGAEGYQQIGLMPGVLKKNSPGIGVALKISDGDNRGRVRPAVILEVLRQLGAISEKEMGALAEFGPRLQVENWRKINVGEGYPIFNLKR